MPTQYYLRVIEKLYNYAIVWRCLILSVLRLSRVELIESLSSQSIFNSRQTAIVIKLLICLEINNEIISAILDLSMTLIQNDDDRSILKLSVCYFLDVRRYNSTLRRWKNVTLIFKDMSALIYFFCLLTLYQYRQNLNELKTITRKYLWNNTRTSFFEIFNLRVFAREKESQFNQREIARWSLNRQSVFILDINVNVMRWKEFLQDEIDDLLKNLLQLLFVHDSEYLNDYDLANFHDNWQWSINEDSFTRFAKLIENVRLLEDFLQTDMWRLVHRAARERTSSLIVKNHVDFDTQRMIRYMHRCQKWLIRLIVMILVTVELLMRETELCRLKIANDSLSLRNIVIHSNYVVMMIDYNKIESVTHRSTIISRYLSNFIKRMIIAFEFEVRMLLKTATLEEDLSSLLFFVSRLSFIKFDRISTTLSEMTNARMNISLSLNSYRHLAVILYREYIKEQVDESIINVIFQTKHESVVDSAHYVLIVDMLHRISNVSLVRLFKISKQWHEMLRLDSKKTVCLSCEREIEFIIAIVNDAIAMMNWNQCSVNALSSADIMTADIISKSAEWTNVSDNHLIALNSVADIIFDYIFSHDDNVASQLFKQRRLDDESLKMNIINALRRVLHNKNAWWKFNYQEKTLLQIIKEKNVLVITSSSSDKTMNIVISTLLDHERTTIVIVSYISLKQNLRTRCRNVRIQSVFWDKDRFDQYSLLFVTSEIAANSDFRKRMQNWVDDNTLTRVIIDEVHVLVFDVYWRSNVVKLDWLTDLNVSLADLNDTLSSNMTDAVMRSILRDREYITVRASHSSTIERSIIENSQKILEQKFQIIVATSTTERVTLIFAMFKNETKRLEEKLVCSVYTSDELNHQRKIIISRLQKQKLSVVVRTFDLELELDLSNIRIVMHWRETFFLIDLTQQAARSERDIDSDYSIMLLTRANRSRLKAKNSRTSLTNYVVHERCLNAIINEYMNDALYSDMICDSLSSLVCFVCSWLCYRGRKAPIHVYLDSESG